MGPSHRNAVPEETMGGVSPKTTGEIRMARHRYTRAQVSSMLVNPCLWLSQLRDAARERGCELSSVADIDRVLAWLRTWMVKA